MEIRLLWPDDVPRSEFSQQFLQGMLDRMAMSYSTYGKVKDAFPDKVDAIDSSKRRVTKYTQTKNQEWLMDAANFIMIEFMCPSIEGAHFEPTSAKDSPGRKWHGEGFNRDQNT
jgi:hypothetical protein